MGKIIDLEKYLSKICNNCSNCNCMADNEDCKEEDVLKGYCIINSIEVDVVDSCEKFAWR